MNTASQVNDLTERWKITHNDRYEVSSQGRVKRVKYGQGNRGKGIIKHSVDRGGYAWIRIGKKIYMIHHLVMGAFVGPRPAGFEVDHRDGNKINNSLENLEYVTPSENIRRAIASGKRVPLRGEKHGQSKLTWKTVRLIRKLKKLDGISNAALSRKFGVTPENIGYIIRNQTWVE